MFGKKIGKNEVKICFFGDFRIWIKFGNFGGKELENLGKCGKLKEILGEIWILGIWDWILKKIGNFWEFWKLEKFGWKFREKNQDNCEN